MNHINLNNFHLSEPEFNILNNRDRLKYLLSKFHVGMDVTVKVNNRPCMEAKIFGFYDYNIYKEGINGVFNGKTVKSYNVMPDLDEKIPSCNVWVMIDGELSGYYPLWIYPDFVKIRNDKLETIGING